jgi:hypothetical protein
VSFNNNTECQFHIRPTNSLCQSEESKFHDEVIRLLQSMFVKARVIKDASLTEVPFEARENQL